MQRVFIFGKKQPFFIFVKSWKFNGTVKVRNIWFVPQRVDDEVGSVASVRTAP